MGVHWEYSLSKLEEDYGWVTDYEDPARNPYHGKHLSKGALTQSGELSALLVRTLAETGEYDEAHFTALWDGLLAECDGTRKGGRHGWTNKDMCDVYRRRVREGKAWGPETASPTCDTTDSICRAAILAARYYSDLPTLCEKIKQTSALQYADVGVTGQALCFGIVVAMLIRGEPLDSGLSSKLYALAQEGELPFSFLRGDRDEEPGLYEPDGLLLFGEVVGSAQDPAMGGSFAEPHKVLKMYGKACAWFMCLPSAYFLAGRFSDSFEDCVLNAVNGGGQNVARASLCGALLGAHKGASSMPPRFLDGLQRGDEFVTMANKVANAHPSDDPSPKPT